jgi:hypothetical protein
MATAPNPDAPLIELCVQFEALRVEFHKSCQDLGEAEGAAAGKHRHLGTPALWVEVNRDLAYREAKRRTEDIVRRTHALFEAIGQMRATTMEGIMAKARVTASECFVEGGIEVEADQYTEGVTPHYMALALVRDLLRINGGQA